MATAMPASFPLATSQPQPPSTPVSAELSTPRLRSSPRQINAVAGSSRSPLTPLRSSQPPPSPSTRAPRRNSSPTAAPPAAMPEEHVQAGPKYLQPSEFFPLNNGAGGRYVPPYTRQGGDQAWLSPEDDPEAKRGIPIFRPTMEEFKASYRAPFGKWDFEEYVNKTVPWGQYSGIAKIIPPAEWTEALPPISGRTLSEVRIKSPIQQTMLGRSGLFRVTNVEKRKMRPLDVHEWFDKCQNPRFVGPGPKDGDRTLDRDSKEAKERVSRAQAEIKAKRLERKEKLQAAKQRKAAARGGPAPVEGHDEESKAEADATDEPVPELAHSPHSSSSSDPRAQTPNSDTAVDPFYRSFDPKTAWLPRNTSEDDYTPEACAGMEKKFWKNLLTREPSWYGADLQGSLFVDKSTPWNVSCLPNLLNRCSLTKKLPGVNSPYLYFGMYGATFAWHVEDMDLFSINYIHFGAPKFWYAVPQRHAERFENTLAGYFPQDAQRCDQFLRHKSFTMSASQLANDKIPVNMLVHKQNEFVITYPRGYHAGFNMGFNCAESINFALESWLELGRRAKVCECVEHSVRINVDEMLAEKQLVQAIEDERKVGRPRKRKSEVPNAEGADSPRTKSGPPRPRKVKIIRQSADGTHVEEEVDEVTDSVPQPKRKRVKLDLDDNDKKPHKAKPVIIKDRPSYPCLLCPSLSTDNLRPVHQPTDAVRAHSHSLTPQEGLMAHHECALGIPEVGIRDIMVDDQGTLVQHVVDTDRIETARWKLKCHCCQDKKLKSSGAKVQCVKKSCLRAFHVSCAIADPKTHYEVYEVTELPPLPPDGSAPSSVEPIKRMNVELLCELHNPDQIQLRRTEAAKELRDRVMLLVPGTEIKVKNRGWGIARGTFIHGDRVDVKVDFDSGGTLMVPFDRVDLKERKPAKVVENEYARTYNTKAKEPISIASSARSNPVAAPAPRAMPPAAATATATAGPTRFPAPAQIPTRVVNGGPPPLALAQHAQMPPPNSHYAFAPQPYYMAPPPAAAGWSAGPPHSNGYSAGGAGAGAGPSRPPPPSANEPMLPPPVNGHGGAHDRSDKIDLTLHHMHTLMMSLPPIRTPAIHLAGTNGKGSVSAILESVLLVAGLHVGRYNSPHLVEARDAIRINGTPVHHDHYHVAMSTVQHQAQQRGIPISPFEHATAAAFFAFATAQPPLDVIIVECGMGGVNDATNVIPPNLTLASALTSVGLDHTSFLGNTIAAIADQKARITVRGGLLFTAPHLHPDAQRVAHRIGYERSAAVIEARISSLIPSMQELLKDDKVPLSLWPFSEPAPTPVSTRLPVIQDGQMFPGDDVIKTRLSLGGQHQLDNLSLALTILHVLSKDKRALSIQPNLARVTPPVMQRGVELTRWEGRCSWIQYKLPSPSGDGAQVLPVLVDGAHNADSSKTLRDYLDSLHLSSTSIHFVISLSASPGKSPDSVLRPLLRPNDTVTLMDFTTPVEGMPWVRPAPKQEVRDAIVSLLGTDTDDAGRVEVEDKQGVEGMRSVLNKAGQAFFAAKDDSQRRLTVVCGSLYLVADVYRLLAQTPK